MGCFKFLLETRLKREETVGQEKVPVVECSFGCASHVSKMEEKVQTSNPPIFANLPDCACSINEIVGVLPDAGRSQSHGTSKCR